MYSKTRYDSLSSLKKDLYSLESIDGFYYKLLTILSLICSDEKGSCFCKKYEEFERGSNFICPLCCIPMFVYNFREDFLVCFRDKPFLLLTECFIMKKSFIAVFAGPFLRYMILRTIS